MRPLLLLGLLCACAGPAATGAPVLTSERDAKLSQSLGAIGGIIRDAYDGTPLSMVSIQAENGGERVAHDISDHEGRYRLGPLEPGRYDVSAKFAGARVAHKDIGVENAQETHLPLSIDTSMPADASTSNTIHGARGSIEGIVLDPSREPFAGIAVSLSARHLEDVVMTITDAEAAFQFRGLRPAVYSLSAFYTLVEQQGSVDVHRGNVVVKPGETTTVELVLKLKLQ